MLLLWKIHEQVPASLIVKATKKTFYNNTATSRAIDSGRRLAVHGMEKSEVAASFPLVERVKAAPHSRVRWGFLQRKGGCTSSKKITNFNANYQTNDFLPKVVEDYHYCCEIILSYSRM